MLGSKGPPIGNGIWAIKWSRDRWLPVKKSYSPQRQQTDRQTLTDTQSNKMTEQRGGKNKVKHSTVHTFNTSCPLITRA